MGISSEKKKHPGSKSSRASSKRNRILANVDLSSTSTTLWLVKVPKYVAAKWDKASSGTEVAKIRVMRQPGTKTEVNLDITESIARGKLEIPRQHKMNVTPIAEQTFGIFSREAPNQENEKLSFEGTVIQKFECKPQADSTYMKLKMESIKRAAIPKKTIKQLDRVVQNFKPVSNHKMNIEYAEKKKNEGKMMREEKHVVLDMIFGAFEKHQYYNLKDLVKITRQPVVYLKEILNEVAIYNMKNPHRNMWELKPEYRHYNNENSGAVN